MASLGEGVVGLDDFRWWLILVWRGSGRGVEPDEWLILGKG